MPGFDCGPALPLYVMTVCVWVAKTMLCAKCAQGEGGDLSFAVPDTTIVQAPPQCWRKPS
jgi:hypothetical protein